MTDQSTSDIASPLSPSGHIARISTCETIGYNPHRVQPDALEIEAGAKREYDGAQERGGVARLGDNLPSVTKRNANKPTAADVGLTKPAKPPPMAGRKQEVRQLRE
jgi:hypothetical protein